MGLTGLIRLTELTGTEGTWIRGNRTHRGIWLLVPGFELEAEFGWEEPSALL